jgi:hypothetical protein
MTTAIETHLDAVRQIEHDRQQAAATTAAEAKKIDIAYHRAHLASALATGVSPSVSLQALRSLGAELVAPLPPVPPVPEFHDEDAVPVATAFIAATVAKPAPAGVGVVPPRSSEAFVLI